MGFKNRRLSANLTQEEVASIIHVSRTTVSMWESGESKPRSSRLLELANLYKCTVDDLLREDEETQHMAGRGK